MEVSFPNGIPAEMRNSDPLVLGNFWLEVIEQIASASIQEEYYFRFAKTGLLMAIIESNKDAIDRMDPELRERARRAVKETLEGTDDVE